MIYAVKRNILTIYSASVSICNSTWNLISAESPLHFIADDANTMLRTMKARCSSMQQSIIAYMVVDCYEVVGILIGYLTKEDIIMTGLQHRRLL